jgi:hypothetical protein
VIVVCNSSPLIALSAIDRLDILSNLFESVFIPEDVYRETVTTNHMLLQKSRIQIAVDQFIRPVSPKFNRTFSRRLGPGETGVLNLALEIAPDFVMLDDKKARKEAATLNLPLLFTTDVLRWAAHRRLIDSYPHTVQQLAEHQIYLPGTALTPT